MNQEMYHEWAKHYDYENIELRVLSNIILILRIKSFSKWDVARDVLLIELFLLLGK